MNDLSADALAIEAHEKAMAYYKGAEHMFYKAILEIKTIRDERYYRQLGYGNFGDYCSTHWDCDRDFMNNRITLAERYGETFDDAHRQLGHTKMLMLSRLEPDQRQDFIKSHPVDEMTTRELQQVIKDKKELERLLQEERSKPPTTIERTVEKEVVPPDYYSLKKSVSELKDAVTAKETALASLRGEKELLEQKAKLSEKEAEQYKKLKTQITALTQQKQDMDRQITSAAELGGLVVEIEDFLKTKLSPVRYSRSLERLDSKVSLRNLTDILGMVEKWCGEMRNLIPSGNYVEVTDYESID